ncbi:hypothetical protein BDW71DRAFT_216144 [Aspergillus fruticulosus]
MSNQGVPTRILKKKQISQQEYDLREEWAPETVNEYQVIPNEHTPTRQLPSRLQREKRTWQPQAAEKQQTESQYLPHHQVATVSKADANADMQGRVPNKRSLLFEEWKARSVRSPEQMKEPGSSTAVRKGNNIETKRSTTSGDVRVLLGERFHKVRSGAVKGRPVNDGRGQQPESIDAGNEATSGDGRKPLVEHTVRAANINATPEPANKDPIQHPKVEKTRDKATSKDGRAPLGEHSDKATDPQATTNPENEGYVQQTGTAKTVKTTTSNGTRGHERKSSKRTTIVQAKTSPTNDGYSQQREVKTDNANEEGHTPAPPSENADIPLATPGASTREKGGRRRKSRGWQEDPGRQSPRGRPTSHERQSSQGRLAVQELRHSHELQFPQALQSVPAPQASKGHRNSQARHPSHARHPCHSRQGSIERQQRPRERAHEQAVYMAPNGTQFGVNELRRLAHGLRVSGNVKVFFIPCFIEDPWRDVEPVPCIRPPDLMSRF